MALYRITYPRFLGKSLMCYQAEMNRGKVMRHEKDEVVLDNQSLGSVSLIGCLISVRISVCHVLCGPINLTHA
jgi:hypothetical protein